MKITRVSLKRLIRECILRESREAKQQFYNQVRSKYPDIDRAFFVTWHGDGVRDRQTDELIKPVWDFTEESVRELLKKVESNPTFDIACNLVDPAGKNVLPHKGTWGPVGIVLQGIPTAGYNEDVASSQKDSRKETGRWRVYDKADYDVERDLFTDYAGKKVFDKNIPNPFISHQPSFDYSYNEFAVVPKKIVGIVYHNDIPWIEQNSEDDDVYHWSTLYHGGFDPNYIGDKMRDVGKKLNLPVAVGPYEISDFYRSLYGNTQATQTLLDDDIDF